MALGLDNGSIRVQLLESRDISKLNSYWSQNMHDNHYGAVTNVSLSFDERFLLSVGSDGNFFVYSFMEEEKLKVLLGKQMADIVNNVSTISIMFFIADSFSPLLLSETFQSIFKKKGILILLEF